MSLTLDYKWIPQDGTTVRAEHCDLDYKVFRDAPTLRSPACRCYAAPLRPMTRYPKRWSRAKRKEAMAAAIRQFVRWMP